jgi:hypothetical protein
MDQNPYIQRAFQQAVIRDKEYMLTIVLPILMQVKKLPHELWSYIVDFLCTTSTVRVNMLIMRSGIFYKDTLLVFQCNYAYMLKIFERQYKMLLEDRARFGFGRGDHDDLLDHPLDTFCNNSCCQLSTLVKCSSVWMILDFPKKEDMLRIVEQHVGSISRYKDIIHYEQKE